MEACHSTLKDGRTEQLIPVTKSSCYGINYRFALSVLALIKQVLSMGLLLILIYFLLLCYSFGKPNLFYHILIWITISVSVVDIVIGVIIIISVCMENRRLMKICYIYSICAVGLLTFLCCMTLYLITLVALLIIFVMLILGLMMQKYLSSGVGECRAVPVTTI